MTTAYLRSIYIPSAGSPEGTTSIFITPQDEIFRGHYPEFAILPGVALVELSRRAVIAHLGLSSNEPIAEIESARFRGPVFPGDEVGLHVEMFGDQRARATLTCCGSNVASVRLRLQRKTA